MGEGEEGVQERDSSILASVTSRNNIKWNSMQKCPIAFQSTVNMYSTAVCIGIFTEHSPEKVFFLCSETGNSGVAG